MLEVIEKLLILQDRDRKIQRVEAGIARVGPERDALQGKLSGAQAQLEAAKLREKQIETDRKKLELDAEAQKQLIEKYSLQQFQTKKNEEYRALAKEIEHCKETIGRLEDQQLELMMQADEARKNTQLAQQAFNDAKKVVDQLVAELAQKEIALQKELAELEAGYDQLTAGVEEGALNRYLRLQKSKGENVVVGIERSVCGGCHMKLPPHIVLGCQAQQEIVNCNNCGRILYFAPYMDLSVVD